MVSFLEEWLDKIKGKNPQLLKQIMIVILRYHYVCEYLNGSDMKYVKEELAECVEDILNITWYADIIGEFVNFDFTEFTMLFSKIPTNVMDDFTSLINIENTKLYGTNGTWVKYDKNSDIEALKKHLFNYCYSWIYNIDYFIMNKNYDIYIYYSEDKDKNNVIPRICISVDNVNNCLYDVTGKDSDSVELELVDVLEDKLKELDLLKENKLVINNLKRIRVLKAKLESNIKLSKQEIDFVYEITGRNKIDFDCNYKRGRFRPRYLANIKKISNEKKDLAKYFNCLESEVITEEDNFHWNKDMVVTTSLRCDEEKCNYPKLKAILGPLMATTLKSAESLDNLIYVADDVLCESLESSLHLENLIRIGGLAQFSNMIDTSHFNPDLVIENGAVFKDGNAPKNIKILNKEQ